MKVYYVMYPPLFKRFNKDYALFKSYGITIIPTAFRGQYHFKRYSQAYSTVQKETLLKFTNDENKKILGSVGYNFKGKKCLAGKSLIVIKNDGRAYRCYGDNHYIGSLMKGNIKLYKTAKICISNNCSCPEHGFRYVIPE